MPLAESQVPDAAERAARILIVDDNDDNCYTLQLQLEIEGFEKITIARDGEDAISILQDSAFDVILLDVMMPKVDGYQVLSWLKARPDLHDLPVIMISALDEMDSVIRCIKLGAVDYLSKPFDPILLKARLGASLEKKRLRDVVKAHLSRIEAELDSARQLQMAMIPTLFPPPTRERPVEIFAMMQPAHEVGGDLYDFFYAPDGTFCFLVGDVSGKSIPAALFMARTKNLIRLVTRLTCAANGAAQQPSDIVGIVNQELAQDNAGMMFVTLFFGMLRFDTRKLHYCNAGHPAPYLLNSGDIKVLGDARGRALGIRITSTYHTGSLALTPGGMVYLFSDGVTEANNAAGELFSDERLKTVLQRLPDLECNSVVDSVTSAVKAFAAGIPQSDDITAMAVRLVPEFTG
jgi:sigma-B regulation protein RsbU (phosphoserine phosphatase)